MSKGIGVTGSGLERAEACVGSVVLRQADRETIEGRVGTSNHEAVALSLFGDCEGLPPVVREAIKHSKAFIVEPMYVIDIEAGTARHIGNNLGRRYPEMGPHEVGLTADLVCLDTRAVWDWKSSSRVTAVGDNFQLNAAAFAAAKAHGWDTVETLGIGYLDNSYADTCRRDGIDIQFTLDRLRSLRAKIEAARAEGGVPKLGMGLHCAYCPALNHCPEHTALLRAALAKDDLGEPVEAADCGRAYVELLRLEDMVKRQKSYIQMRARRERVPLPDGKRRLSVVESSRRGVNNKKAAQILDRLGIKKSEYEETVSYSQVRVTSLKGEDA